MYTVLTSSYRRHAMVVSYRRGTLGNYVHVQTMDTSCTFPHWIRGYTHYTLLVYHLYGIPYLVYSGLQHIELHISRCVLDGSVDNLHGPGLISALVVVLGQQEQGPQQGAGGLQRTGIWWNKVGSNSTGNSCKKRTNLFL